jgi:hemerythrin superfamily protein
MNATALLKQQHKDVKSLFEEVLEVEDPESRRQLCERIGQALVVHTKIEEELFYPAVRELGDKAEEMILEAYEEHHVVDLVLAELPEIDPEDERFHAKMTVLQELVDHHVKEEEKEMFPALKETELDLKELGSQLAQRKMQLMEQMGIEAEEPPAPRRKRSTGSRTSAAKGRQARAGSRTKSARTSGSRARH